MLSMYVRLYALRMYVHVLVSVVSHTVQTYLKDLTEHTRMAFEYSVCLNALVT